MSTQLRQRVVDLYKTLYFMGREYPQGSKWFHDKLKKTFLKNKNEKDPKKIEQMISHGEFVVKELEAMYSLRKYRAMKQRYYDDQEEENAMERLREMKELASHTPQSSPKKES